MKKLYTLKSAFTFNGTGEKVNAIASPVNLQELRDCRNCFYFDFALLLKDYHVYKLQTCNQESTIQGLVGFRRTPGVLECANMEIHNQNKRGNPVYNGIGKAMVALCCKVSNDEGFEGFICFDAKNKLIPYYRRLGARRVFGLKMVVEPREAQTLIDLFF
jgi:hypothetical protein